MKDGRSYGRAGAYRASPAARGGGRSSRSLFLPALLLLGNAASERAAAAEVPYQSLSEALGSILTLSTAMAASQSTLALLAAVGLLVAVRRRVMGAWIAVTAVILGLYLAASVSSGFWHALRPLTMPWYSSTWRTSYQVPMAMAVFVGLALAAAVEWLRQRSVASWWPRTSLAAVTALFVVGGAALWLWQPVDILQTAYATDSLITDDQRAAFDYLASHTRRTDLTLNEERDGSAWLYAIADRRPLLAVYTYTPDPATKDRIYLLEHIAELGTNQRARKLVDRWCVKYVLVNEQGFTDEPPRLQPRQRSPRTPCSGTSTGGVVPAVRSRRSIDAKLDTAVSCPP